MAPPGGADLTFKIYGLEAMAGEVFADVFARKISAIVRGLKQIDKIYNEGKRHEFVISNLSVGSAEVAIREKLISKKSVRRSPAHEMLVYGAIASRAVAPHDEAQEIMIATFDMLCRGAKERFDYATLKNGSDAIIRIDPFLSRQIEKIRAGREAERAQSRPRYFVGEAVGSFDGIIQAVDLKGEAPEARLILSAGGIPIECVLIGMDLDEVRKALGSRVSATGSAIYEGDTGLPTRIEVRSITSYPRVPISQWSGSLRPAELDDWQYS